MPASEYQLAEFITYLADTIRVVPSTIKTYLAAVRSLHVENGYGDPFHGTTLPHRVFIGVKRVIGAGPRLLRMPITYSVLQRLLRLVQGTRRLNHQDQLMFGAACSVAFFGFLRCGELVNLQRSDVTVLNQPTKHLALRIQSSKTDPFRQGCSVYIGCTDGPNAAVCPVRLVEAYKKVQPPRSKHSSFFMWTSNEPLTRLSLTSTMQRILQDDGCLYASAYKGHSFRSGAATTAGTAGLPDWLIKTMGRWTSDAYQVYIKTPRATLLDVSSTLTVS